jgi:hypothetical protein
MGKEKFVLLLHVSDIEYKLICDRLKRAGIETRVQDYSQNAWFRIYGGTSLIGKKIFVPEAKLSEARDLLRLDGQSLSADKKFYFAKSQRLLYRAVRLFIIIILLQFVIAFFYSGIFYFRLWFK